MTTPWPIIILDAHGNAHPSTATVHAILQGAFLPYNAIIPLGFLKRLMEKSEFPLENRFWGAFTVLMEHTLNQWANNSEISKDGNNARATKIATDMVMTARRLAQYLSHNSSPHSSWRFFETIPPALIKKWLNFALNTEMCSMRQAILAALDHRSQ